MYRVVGKETWVNIVGNGKWKHMENNKILRMRKDGKNGKEKYIVEIGVGISAGMQGC